MLRIYVVDRWRGIPDTRGPTTIPAPHPKATIDIPTAWLESSVISYIIVLIVPTIPENKRENQVSVYNCGTVRNENRETALSCLYCFEVFCQALYPKQSKFMLR